MVGVYGGKCLLKAYYVRRTNVSIVKVMMGLPEEEEVIDLCLQRLVYCFIP